MRMDKSVRETTGYVLVWVLVLSVIMEAVFLLIGKWETGVLAGNLIGAIAAVGNFFFMAVTIVKIVNSGNTEQLKQRMGASKSLRYLGMTVVCILGIAVLKTNVYATLLPLLFPRIGLQFKQLKTPGTTAGEDEGSELT